MVYLNRAAAAVLDSQPRDPSGWVLPGAKAGCHLVNLQKPWRRIRQSAQLEDVRIHDLRHSFASVAAGLGEGLHMIGKLLGHTQAQTTHRYAHLAADPVKQASERIAEAIAGMIGVHGELSRGAGQSPTAQSTNGVELRQWQTLQAELLSYLIEDRLRALGSAVVFTLDAAMDSSLRARPRSSGG